MPSKPKTSRREYSDEIVGIILAPHEASRLYAQIANKVKVSQPSVVHNLYQATHILNEPYYLTKRDVRPSKLDTQA